MVTKHLYTHTCMRSCIQGWFTPGQGAWATTGFVYAGKFAPFLAAEPTPKQEHGSPPRFLQVPQHCARTDISTSDQGVVISSGCRESEAEQAREAPDSLKKQQQGCWSYAMSWAHIYQH